MPSVTVTEEPQDLGVLLGVEARAPDGLLWRGVFQNTSHVKTVYRMRSITQPDPTGPAFRHRPGEIFRLAVWNSPRTWLWVSSGSACVVTEEESSI